MLNSKECLVHTHRDAPDLHAVTVADHNQQRGLISSAMQFMKF